MVQDRIVDGYRIAELLASEVDGRRRGPLGRLAVVDADRTVSGTPEGERAYDVRLLAPDRDPRREPTPDDAGRLLAEVLVHPDGASVSVECGVDAAVETAEAADLDVERADRGAVIRVAYAAQVKRVADALGAASDAVTTAEGAG